MTIITKDAVNAVTWAILSKLPRLSLGDVTTSAEHLVMMKVMMMVMVMMMMMVMVMMVMVMMRWRTRKMTGKDKYCGK